MGRSRTGYEAGGGAGKRCQLNRVELAEQRAADMALAKTDGIEGLTRPWAPLAVRTLVKICKSRKANPASVVSAAKSLLEFAHGRAKQQPPTAIDAGGLIINIVNLTGGEKTSAVEVDVTAASRNLAEDEVGSTP